MARVLIIGALGFMGRYLIRHVAGGADEIHGADLQAPDASQDDDVRRLTTMSSLDIRHESQVAAALDRSRPQIVYHFASIVPIRLSIESPANTLMTNVVGTANILQAIQKSRLKPRVIMAGSGDEYGLVHPCEIPVTEEQPLRPSNPYAVSKAAQALLGMQYFRSYGIEIIVGRTFNLTGPGQGTDYACPAFARQIAEIEQGLCEPVLKVGNLSPRRDYNDVRDVVRAYALLAAKGCPGQIYNICTGKSISMHEILGKLLSMSTAAIRVEVDPAKVRPAENELIIGDNRKISEATQYRPQYEVDKTLADILEYWRGKVRMTHGRSGS